MERKTLPKVLFLCTANACRSQMAEGWARQLRRGDFEAYSAGVMPVGVSRRAVDTMARAGVDISLHRSKHVVELSGVDFDLVVTLCDSARRQCPAIPNARRIIHLPVYDPTFAPGTEQAVVEAFDKTRDEIRRLVEELDVDSDGD
jgi:arsenate reductase